MSRPPFPKPVALLALASMLLPSSPIRAEESPAEEAPAAVDSVAGTAGTEVTPTSAEDLRALLAEGDLAEALVRVRRELAGGLAGARQGALRLVEARILTRQGESWEAIRTYRRLLDDPVLGATALEEIHDLYVARGQFDAAADLRADRAGAVAEDRLARMAAHAASVEGRWAEAARLAEAAASRGDARAALLRANALLALGDRDGAEALYLGVLGDSREPALRQVAHFGLGQVARLRGGRAVRALQDEKAARLGDAPWAELDRGLALRALGRRDEAREQLGGVAAARPALAPTARLALARLDEEEGRVDEAVEHLVRAIRGDVGDFLAWTRLGDLLLQEGEEDAGIAAYREAERIVPGFPAARERLVRALAARGRWEEAPSGDGAASWARLPGWTWERLLDGDLPYHELVADRDSIPADDPRRAVLALVQLRAGFPAAALGWAAGAPAGTPVLGAIRAEALERVGRTDEALETWRSVVAAEDSPIAREALARLTFREDPAAAAAEWDALFARWPGAARARIRRAQQLEKAGELAAARDAWRSAEESGWLSPRERKRARTAIRDLEDAIREEEELRVEG